MDNQAELLVATTHVGPLEGAIWTAFRVSGRGAVFVDPSTGARLSPGPGNSVAPDWWSAEVGAVTTASTRAFTRSLRDLGVSKVLSIGVSSAVRVEPVLRDAPFDTAVLFPQGESDFSARRFRWKAQAISRLGKGGRIPFLFFDEWESTRAIAQGSGAVHRRLPFWSSAGEAYPVREEGRHVSFIIPDGDPTAHEATVRRCIDAMGDLDLRYDIVTAGSLFTKADLAIGRTFPANLRYRLRDATHVVLLGSGRDHPVIACAFSGRPDRILVQESLQMSRAATLCGLEALSGAALISRFRDFVLGNLTSPSPSAALVDNEPAAARLMAVIEASRPLPAAALAAELLPNVPPGGEFDLFYSVSPIEDNASGARPMRLKNVAKAGQAFGNVITITSNERIFERRFHEVERLIGAGYRLRIVYGESSTSPHATVEALLNFRRLLELARRAKATTVYFIRDLHWLSPDAEVAAGGVKAIAPDIRARGNLELQIVEELVDIAAAPSAASARMFDELLGNEVSLGPWLALPPAVSNENACQLQDAVADEGVTFVYSGGIGSVYRMETYLDAVASLCERDLLAFEKAPLVRFDFIVREPEVKELLDQLAERGLDRFENIRILHTSFDSYVASTTRAVGVVLLDSDYGRQSFPYKTVSYLEHGYPVLAFEDMGNSDFLRAHGIGILAPRELAGVSEIMRQIRDGTIRWPSIDKAPTWSDLWSTVRAAGQQRRTL